MNVKNACTLVEWIDSNREQIIGQNLHIGEIRLLAEADLAFTCSGGAIKDALDHHRIPVRRSKQDARAMYLEGLLVEARELFVSMRSLDDLPRKDADEIQDRRRAMVDSIDDALEGA